MSRRKEVERKVEPKGRVRAADFRSNTYFRSKSAILVSISVSFNCTILASVLTLCASCCLSLVSSKYFSPRVADIQTERNKHADW
jgi:hypothetical protein